MAFHVQGYGGFGPSQATISLVNFLEELQFLVLAHCVLCLIAAPDRHPPLCLVARGDRKDGSSSLSPVGAR